MWRKYTVKRNTKNRLAYNKAVQNCRSALYDNQIKTELKILSNPDLGKFYRYVNAKLSCKTGIAPLLNNDNEYVFSNSNKADLLNDFFTSVCTVDNNVMPVFETKTSNSNLNTIVFTRQRVLTNIKKSKNSMSSGPDGIPTLFFKKLQNCLSGPISVLFQIIFDSGECPTIWKHAYVIPVFKKGQSSRVENYRPISLTCVLCKFFESVIKLDLSEYLAQNNILNDAQHGFLSRHSTCTNLLESINDWSLNIKNGHHSRIIFIDFAKAFDTVCHSKLLYKMSRLGIDGKLLRMLSSYLNCRTQQVLLDGALSDTKRVISGVPQGSVLGPLFFLIYINDFVEVLPKTIISKLFADDAKLYTEMKGDLDADYLQTGLDNLCKWAKKWQLKISYNKCFSMDVGLKRTQQPYPDHSIDGVLLSSVNECRDLGVIVDNKLHFTTLLGNGC